MTCIETKGKCSCKHDRLRRPLWGFEGEFSVLSGIQAESAHFFNQMEVETRGYE